MSSRKSLIITLDQLLLGYKKLTDLNLAWLYIDEYSLAFAGDI